jgi:hypothetical protein
LSDTSAASSGLPPEAATDGFDNEARLLTVDDNAIDAYDTVASALVEQAFAAGSPSRQQIVTCDLSGADTSCAPALISIFARRAWRRPVTPDEQADLMPALNDAQAQSDSIEEGVKLAFRMVLVSPNFLYRVEIDPPGAGLHSISPYELATRLSYFIWSSTPDDVLLSDAASGMLSQPGGVATEIARMLADPRADALVTNFADQWLNTRLLSDGIITPAPEAFPSFDSELQSAMVGETQAFFRFFLSTGRSVADMIDANFTFANQRLATFYGLAGVTGTDFQQVSLDGTQRAGLLGQASILTATSLPIRTSVPRRGKWVLSKLLCTPPGNPPNNVPPLDPNPPNVGPNPTPRQLLAPHEQKGSSCAGCHTLMDPIGFGLEHFDGIGAWRDTYAQGVAIDATGALPGGTAFDGEAQLAAVLKQDPRVERCFVQNLFTFAMGRSPTSAGDSAAIDELTSSFKNGGSKIQGLVSLIAASDAFQKRGGQP